MSEEQDFFRDSVRKFLETETPLGKVRQLAEDPAGFERSWWKRAAELGFLKDTLRRELARLLLAPSPARGLKVLRETGLEAQLAVLMLLLGVGFGAYGLGRLQASPSQRPLRSIVAGFAVVSVWCYTHYGLNRSRHREILAALEVARKSSP